MTGWSEKHIGAHVIIRTVLLSQLLFGSVTTSQSLTDVRMGCYTCTSTEEGSRCETNPSTLPHAVLQSCPRDICTIVRVENWPSGRVKSFYRGCDGRSKVFERDHCQIEKDERTCFTACVGDLCNVGDGTISANVNSASDSPRSRSSLLETIGYALLATFSLRTV